MNNARQNTSKTFHKNILVNIEVYADFRVLLWPRPKPFLYFTKKLIVKSFVSIYKGFFWWIQQFFFTSKWKIFRLFIIPEQSPLIKTCAVAKIVNFQLFVDLINLCDFNIIIQLMYGPEGNSFFFQISCPDVSRDEVEGNIRTWGIAKLTSFSRDHTLSALLCI